MSHLEAPKGQSSQSVCKRNNLNNKVNGELPKIRKVGCYMNLLNIIEYLFCERLFGKVLLIEKSVAGKVRQKKCEKKSRKKKCDRKIMAEKVRQKNRDRKSAAEKLQ
jgi:hypothetical protein